MKKLSLLLLLVILIAAACNNEPDTIILDIAGLDSFAFDPDPVTVPAGSAVTVNFSNIGSLQHSWVVIGPETQPTLATLEDALPGASSGDVVGGESVSFTFTTPADPGDYVVACTIPGHAAGGMVGTLTVTAE